MACQASRSSSARHRKARRERLLDRHLRAQEVAAQHRQRIQARRGELHLLVLEQAAHQLGARILGSWPSRCAWAAAACGS
jgi:hypothetical protein